MAKFTMGLPTDILLNVDYLQNNAIEIFGGMTRAGAKVVKADIEQRAKTVFKPATAAKLNKKLKITKTYNTPSDGGINTKVAYYGYIPKENGMPFKIRGYVSKLGVPAPFLAALREYGGDLGQMPAQFQRYWKQKKPFVRPAFANNSGITKAMLKAQKELSGGILDD